MQFDMHKRMMLAVSAGALLASAAAFAQSNPSNLEKLGQFKATGASPNIPTISQGGVKADALKKNWKRSNCHTASTSASTQSSLTRATWPLDRRAS